MSNVKYVVEPTRPHEGAGKWRIWRIARIGPFITKESSGNPFNFKADALKTAASLRAKVH